MRPPRDWHLFSGEAFTLLPCLGHPPIPIFGGDLTEYERKMLGRIAARCRR